MHDVEVRTRGDRLRHGKVGHQRPSGSDERGVLSSKSDVSKVLSACLLPRESHGVVLQIKEVCERAIAQLAEVRS